MATEQFVGDRELSGRIEAIAASHGSIRVAICDRTDIKKNPKPRFTLVEHPRRYGKNAARDQGVLKKPGKNTSDQLWLLLDSSSH